ncbi:MAG: polyprenyl synthetase family protein [Candidatus Omnitrophica bacterium]|nr:polyprenyl synthetase family protein [Candidatus Omnitrophota bacterium]
MKYENYFKNYIQLIEKTLNEILPQGNQYPNVIHEAMRYAVLHGGKRFRPVLTLAAAEAAGGKTEDARLAAAGIELIHAYSLVHDDLPALDNDAVRRGNPTVHKKFGESIAVLTGDGLLTLAFNVLSQISSAEKAVRLIGEISTAAGSYGMIGGQVADIESSDRTLSLPMLDYINIHKTGKLIKVSAVAGAVMGGASPKGFQHIAKYGELLGLAFQSIDDMLDGDGYLQLMKIREVRQKVRDLIAQAKREVRVLGKRSAKLIALANYLLERMPKKVHAKVD